MVRLVAFKFACINKLVNCIWKCLATRQNEDICRIAFKVYIAIGAGS
jgi:hypothetical protein